MLRVRRDWQLVEWLTGAGEKWLLTLREVGESREDAEELLREQDQLAAKSTDILAQVADLEEMSARLKDAAHPRAPQITRHKSHSTSPSLPDGNADT